MLVTSAASLPEAGSPARGVRGEGTGCVPAWENVVPARTNAVKHGTRWYGATADSKEIGFEPSGARVLGAGFWVLG